jgi:hypothetical protein
LNTENAVKLKRSFKNSKLSNEDLIEFGWIAVKEMKLVEKFNNFEFSITGESLIAEGFSGKQLGIELEKRETTLFLASII